MYNRQHGQRRPPTVPQNYSGNAFYRVPYVEPEPTVEAVELPTSEALELPASEEVERTAREEPTPIAEPTEAPVPSLFRLGGKLFPRGLGNEELLILALILMASQSEDGHEILIYLILLLFC